MFKNDYYFDQTKEIHHFSWVEGDRVKHLSFPCTECRSTTQLIETKKMLKKHYVPDVLIAKFRQKLKFNPNYKGDKNV